MQADLNSFSEASEYATRFLAMLAGPLYPILRIVKERLVSLISCTRYFSNSSSRIGLYWILSKVLPDVLAISCTVTIEFYFFPLKDFLLLVGDV